ncbi:helix-turn-helix domain-containing protein [Salinarimonas chemoclinalis]|uniref:helix-turn-helix domain-containing protein n=1 Tax=Salinarimonas chemoclinalis TaxID=3241599 RepID=UPI003555E79E
MRKTLAELRASPPRFSPEERARLLALTDEEIERVAASDPDNPIRTREEIARMVSATRVRRARERSGLSQDAFARQFRLDPARLAEIEAGRLLPDETFLAYLTVIEKEPEVVRRALARDAG